MIVRFDDVEIDTDTVEIRRAGTVVDVQPQVFAVVEYLAGHRERVVTKEELLDNVWGDRFVSESALTSRIKSARKALGDDGSAQRVIRTVHGRGYRFVAEVDGEPDGGSGDVATSDVDEGATVTSSADTTSEGPVARDRRRFDREPQPDRERRPGWPLTGRSTLVDDVLALYSEGARGGVVLHGPSGSGTSRLAAEIGEILEAKGCRVDSIVGSHATASIPFAALAHLVPADLRAETSHGADISRTDLFGRVRAALVEPTPSVADEPQPVLVVDGVRHLDDMTVGIVESICADASRFCVVARSEDESEHRRFDAAVTAGHLAEIRVEALDEAHVDVLLFRSLGGPIDAASLRVLTEASAGLPGVLVDIVESSRRAGTLVSDEGTWRLSGHPVSSASIAWDDGVGPEATQVAQMLSLVPPVALDIVTELVDERVLDELDRRGLLRLSQRAEGFADSGRALVSLRDPLLVGAVRRSVPPLRLRRLRFDTIGIIGRYENIEPELFASIVEWGPEYAATLDAAQLLDAAQTSLMMGDESTAGVLIEHLATHPGAADDVTVSILRGELALRRGQWTLAERIFEEIAVDHLPDAVASLVIRRRASIAFYAGNRHSETIERLADERDRHSPRTRAAIDSRRAGLYAFLGHVDPIFEVADGLDVGDGVTRVELDISIATAHLMRGETTRCLEICGDVEARIDRFPALWRDEMWDGVGGVRTVAHLSHGDIGAAVETIRRHVPVGRRSLYGFLPSAAARVEAYAGRPRSALEILHPVVHSSHRNDFPHFRVVGEAMEVAVRETIPGQHATESDITRVLAEIDLLSGELRWQTAIILARSMQRRGDAATAESLLRSVVEEAQSVGCVLREAEALFYLLRYRYLPADGDELDRFDLLVGGFDGSFWPIRRDHLHAALAGDTDGLRRVGSEYRRLGYVGLARQLEFDNPS